MTTQTDLRLETENSRKPGYTEIGRESGGARKPRRVLWLIVLLIAMAVAGVVGVVVAAHVTDPPAPTRVVYPEPNANDREGRVPTTTDAAHEPSANDREGRVPTTAQEPNANTREGRDSDNR
jgi:hypothetical protein